MEGGVVKVKIYSEFDILAQHTDMYVTDFKNNILVALDNATPEVKKAIDNINSKK